MLIPTHYPASSIQYPVSSIQYPAPYACAVGPPKFIGISICSRSLIGPLAVSKRSIFSASAFIKRLACMGVNMILDFTLLLGVLGITFTKSITNSALLCVMMARLA